MTGLRQGELIAPTDYEMRAQVRETVGYPYLQGESDPLALRVVPGRARHGRKSPRRRCAARRHRLKPHCPTALLLWGLEHTGYKASPEAREQLLGAIEAEAPWLAWEAGAREACVESDDALDAVLCALIARAAALGLTELAPEADLEPGADGGLDHLPREGTLGELAIDRRGRAASHSPPTADIRTPGVVEGLNKHAGT